LENEGSQTHVCKVQTTLHLPESFTVHAQSAVPRRERLITTLSSLLPEVEGDFPKRPADVAEQWGAYAMQGQVHGVIWSDEITEHEWRPWFFDLDSAECTVQPQTRVDLSPLQLYCGPGDWRAVRRIWQLRNGQTAQAQLDQWAMPQGAGPQRIALTPDPIFTLTGEATAQLKVDNVRQQAISGRIIVTPPAGWAVEPTVLPVDALQQGKIVATTLHFASDNVPLGPASGQIQLQTSSFDLVQPLTILRLGDTRQRVAVTTEQTPQQRLWWIDNGRMRWPVAPDFQAGIVGWHEAGSALNHLRSSFPDDGEFEWMKPWFGGLRPTLGSQEGNWPGKLHRESFDAEPVDVVDEQGLPWRGVRLRAAIQQQKTLKGLHVELEYLTLPGSNVLKAIFRLVNTTPVYHRAWNPWLAFLFYCQVDGVYDNAELYGHSQYTGSVQCKRHTVSNWIRVEDWAAVVNPATGRAFTAVCTSQPEGMMLLNSGQQGGHLMVTQSQTLAPHGTNELVLYLALVDSLATAQTYRCLGGSMNRSAQR
jgi:hypothetical protein